MKEIILKPTGAGRYKDNSPQIITDGKLELNIELPAFNGEFYFIAENNGAKFKQLLKDGSIKLENLSAGELKVAVEHYLKGELIKSYSVESLVLKEVDGGLATEPQISELQRRIAELEEGFAEFKKQACKVHNTLYERLKKAEANIVALTKFAYDDYKNNVYLPGGSEEKFLKEYGFITGGNDSESNS